MEHRIRGVMSVMKKISVGLMVAIMGMMVTPLYADSESDMRGEINALKKHLADLESKMGKAVAAPVPTEVKPLTVPSWPVAGIYTAPDTKDLGDMTGNAYLSGIKIRGWMDTHYVANFNDPDREAANTNQGSSAVKARNLTIEGRTFDVHDQALNLSLAELEIEKVPEFGGVGFKFDIAFGETQDIIIDTIKAGVAADAATDSVTSFDKTFQHASVSYVVPWWNGIRTDAGKFVTHIGGETIATAKNWNYSHSLFYTYAIPFQDTGVRINYPWNDKFYTEFYILNGWNVTNDNNEGKTWGPSIGWTNPWDIPWLTVYANYLIGPEQTGNDGRDRQIFDSQIFMGPFRERWNFLINLDVGHEDDVLGGVEGRRLDSDWWGLTGYARYKVNDWLEPSLRLEYFDDSDGTQTLVGQELWSITLTMNMKLGLGKNTGTLVLLRPEIRYDESNEKFFTDEGSFRSQTDQLTLGAGLTWLF